MRHLCAVPAVREAQGLCLLVSPHHPPTHVPLQEERQQLGAQLAVLQAEVAAQAEELAEYAGNDPDRYDNLSERQSRQSRSGGTAGRPCLKRLLLLRLLRSE
jgi:hypothetical protein